MAIRSIEIICLPCDKCERAKKLIADGIKTIELANKTKVVYEFKHTMTLHNLASYSINASQAPAVVINGNVELSGRFDSITVNNKLNSIYRS